MRLAESLSKLTPFTPSICWGRYAAGSQMEESTPMVKLWSTSSAPAGAAGTPARRERTLS